MVEDNPLMNELEELVDFCSRFKEIYIYGHSSTQMLISKYLHYAQIRIQGFIMPEVQTCDQAGEPFPIFNFLEMKKRIGGKILGKANNTGVILSTDSGQYNQEMQLLQMIGIKNFYIMSEWNKRTIPYKMLPRSKENFWVEVNLADHCNLNCQCCDHFSPIAKPCFLDYAQYEKDLQRLAELTESKIGIIKLQGGEPLLNNSLIDFIKVTRKYFPDSLICIFTDGLLLSKWGKNPPEKNIWQAVKDYEIEIRITDYPINLKIDEIKEQCKTYEISFTTEPPPFKKGSRVWYFSEIGALKYKGVKHSVKHPFDLSGNVEPFRFISCHQFNESIVLRDGKIYTCPMIPYVHYFNEYFGQNLNMTENDCIDIYKAKSYEEIAEFCTHRMPFCSYCAVHKRFAQDWKQSEHSIDEWVL